MALTASVGGATTLVAAVAGQLAGHPDLTVVPDGARPDVVVVAAATTADLTTLQRAHAGHPDAAAVVVVPTGDPRDVRRALSYTPGVPVDVTVVEAGSADVPAATHAAAVRTTARRGHATVLANLSALPRGRPSLRATPESLVSVLDRAPLGVLVLGQDGGMVTWNLRATSLLHLSAADVGRPASDVLGGAAVLEVLAASGRADAFTSAVTTEAVRSPGTSIEVNAAASALDDGRPATLLLLVDVTGRRAAEAARDELQDRLAVVRRQQEFLLRASDVLTGATDYADTLEQLATIAVPTVADLCLVDIVESDELRRMAGRHADPARQPVVDRLRPFVPRLDGDHPAAQVVRDRTTRWASHVDRAWLRSTTRSPEHWDAVDRLQFSGYVAVPLTAGDAVLGVVTLVRTEGRTFTADDVVLAEELAGRLALVVAKARRYDREHEIAMTLQRSMLTALPDLDPLRVAARYVPAHADTQVGGDWYDAFVLPGEDPVIAIGDVGGHDVAAASTMGQVRNVVRALALGRSGRPAEVLTALDELNTALRITDFTTVVYGVLGTAPDGGRRLRWSSAGHPPPLLLHADGRSELLPGRAGTVVGVVVPGLERVDHVHDLPPGSTLLLYTDGLVERRGSSLQHGLERLQRVAAPLARETVEDVCDGVLAALTGRPEDDVAVLAVRIP